MIPTGWKPSFEHACGCRVIQKMRALDLGDPKRPRNLDQCTGKPRLRSRGSRRNLAIQWQQEG